ncbi:MAG TPA: hypothetical protein VE621_09810 [Bryobacteraceae bacterium]|jgi:hypothetical protein|nr:hypothetical protein [Bryobacteraceae bacterium]
MLRALWNASKPLTVVGLGMMVVLMFSLVGLLVDSRTITGVPAWLKPSKFAVSTALYSLTFAWIFTYLIDWPRLRAFVGWITALILVLEVAIIDLQAARGTTSHFNIATPLDRSLFIVMGFGIFIVWLLSIAVFIALMRTKIPDRSMAWAVRLGLLITILGTGTGLMMVRPTKAQLAEARSTGSMAISGAHTVGAPDGGPGMAITAWSREHGDLRVPHFFGIHAVQILPLFAWLFARNRPAIVIAAGVAYGAFFLFTLVQAIQGKPFLGGVL